MYKLSVHLAERIGKNLAPAMSMFCLLRKHAHQQKNIQVGDYKHFGVMENTGGCFVLSLRVVYCNQFLRFMLSGRYNYEARPKPQKTPISAKLVDPRNPRDALQCNEYGYKMRQNATINLRRKSRVGPIARRARAAFPASSIIARDAAADSADCRARNPLMAAARCSGVRLGFLEISSINPAYRADTAAAAPAARPAAIGSMSPNPSSCGRLGAAAAQTPCIAARTTRAVMGDGARSGGRCVATPTAAARNIATGRMSETPDQAADRAVASRATCRKTGAGDRPSPCIAGRCRCPPLAPGIPARGAWNALIVPCPCRYPALALGHARHRQSSAGHNHPRAASCSQAAPAGGFLYRRR